MTTTTTTNISALLATMPKLSGSNYFDWIFNIEMATRRDGTWAVLSGAEKEPVGVAATAEALTEWRQKAESGLTAIGLTIEQTQKGYVRGISDGPTAWNALKTVYAHDSRATRITFKKELYNYRHDIGFPISVYINGLLAAASKLAAIGNPVTDLDTSDLLIANLHETWSAMATSLSTNKGVLTTEDVRGALVEEERRITLTKEVNGGTDATKAMYAGNSKGNKGKGQQGGSGSDGASGDGSNGGKTCRRCKKVGHIAENCRTRLPDDEDAVATVAQEINYAF